MWEKKFAFPEEDINTIILFNTWQPVYVFLYNLYCPTVNNQLIQTIQI
jgi:hypothetical protein